MEPWRSTYMRRTHKDGADGEDDFGVRVGELSEMSAVADDNERHLVSEMLDRLREEVKTIESEDWMFESSKNAPR